MSNHKPPLSFEELKAIRERNADNPDVIKLLWEIRRLHGASLRLLQVHRSHYQAPMSLQQCIWEEIKDDPAVKERLALDEPKPSPIDDDETL